MRRTAVGILLLTACVFSGCFKHSVRDERKKPGTGVTDEWKPYLVLGLVPMGKQTLTSQCPSGIALYEVKHSFLNGLLGAVTLNLFTPMTVSFACAAGERPAPRKSDPGSMPFEQPSDEPYDLPTL
jgi:hypothetical protein